MIDLSRFDPALVEEARATWRERAETEWRSLQIMGRFLAEISAVGEPLEICGEVVEMIDDELRHARLCARLCEALGGDPPEAPDPAESPAFVAAPPEQRVAATAISMLAVNETLSVGYLRDLHGRCTQPQVRAVLDAIVADEAGHDAAGWAYAKRALARFPEDAMPEWQAFARAAVQPYRTWADAVLADIDPARRSLDAWSDTERAQLGLFSPQRQALVFEETWRTEVAPRLLALRLL